MTAGLQKMCGSLIPFTWHEPIRCELPTGHSGYHECEDTSWENEAAESIDAYEWGILHARTSEVHRTGFTEKEARSWIAEWEQDGGVRGAFTLIRRPLAEWQRVDQRTSE